MTAQRIYSNRLYIVAPPQGISGFRRPSIPALVTGRRLRRDGFYRWDGRLNINAVPAWRVDDGHLPEHQPRLDLQGASAFLEANPWSYATPAEVTS